MHVRAVRDCIQKKCAIIVTEKTVRSELDSGILGGLISNRSLEGGGSQSMCVCITEPWYWPWVTPYSLSSSSAVPDTLKAMMSAKREGKKLWSVCLEILNTSFIASEEWRCEKPTTVGSVSLFLGSFIIKTKRMRSVGASDQYDFKE